MATESRSKSDVWKFFVVLDNDKTKTKCTVCGQIIAYSGGSTSSMRNHLKKHKSVNLPSETKKQSTLMQFTATQPKMLPVKTEIVHRNLARMCALDLRPLNIVTGTGFQNFVHSLNPSYQIPCRKTIKKYLDVMYDESKKDLVKMLKNKSLSLTTDIWSSVANMGYIYLTGHFLSDNWELTNKLLATRIIDERHTGNNIAKILVDLQKEFEVSEIAAIVTDNASNMDKAAREANYPHLGCFAHTLQLAVNKGLKVPSISRAISAARKLVGHFNHSVLANDALRKRQEQAGVKVPISVVKDVVTWWNSSLYMLDRILLLRVHIYSVIFDDSITKPADRVTLDIKDSNWKVIEDLVPVPKPLAEVREILAAEDKPTASSINILVHNLLSQYLVEDRDSDSCIITDFKSIVRESVAKRLGFNVDGTVKDESLNDIKMMAACLDPRYKSLSFLPAQQRTTVQTNLQDLLDKQLSSLNPVIPDKLGVVIKTEPDTENYDSAASDVKRRKLSDVLTGDVIDLTTQLDNVPSTELAKYIKEPVFLPDPLVWWKLNELKFPRIATLARQFLSVPATSVPSERTFSAAGKTVTKKRASLDPDTIDTLLFLHKNLSRESDCQTNAISTAATSTPLPPIQDNTPVLPTLDTVDSN